MQILGEQHANLLKHAPRGLVGDASLALDLLRGDSATSGTHEVHRLKPDAKRSGAFLEDGSCEWVDVMAATVTRIGSATAHAVMLALFFASFTIDHPARPTLLFDLL